MIMAHCTGPDDWPAVIPYIDIADLHSLAYCDCDISKLAQGIAAARIYTSSNAGLIVNTDGCMSSPRFDPAWLCSFARVALQSNTSPVFISKQISPIEPGIPEAARILRNEGW